MCLGFVKKGRDLIAGYNLDLAVGAWDYQVYAKKDLFYIGIKVGSTVYKTHGVNKNGNFGNLPYMNDPAVGGYRRGKDYQRIDLLVNDYISAKISYRDVLETVKSKRLVNVPNASMHALLCNADGDLLLLEPGLGYQEIHADFAVVSNFPLLEQVDDLSPAWYGKDRYDRACELLTGSDDTFSAMDGLHLLQETRQEGEWATRVSFVYSGNENAVYYVRYNDDANVQKHVFSK